MKIGVLTFHSQINYGGVLQCLALQEYLKKNGHDVQVIDRWMDRAHGLLLGPWCRIQPIRWLLLLMKSLLGSREFAHSLRCIKTQRFIAQYLNLTRYHFYEWGEISSDLGLNLVIVGSDQVWHGGDWGDPEVYMMKDAPHVRSIAYAASFGMQKISPTLMDIYKEGLRRFDAISLREKEGFVLLKAAGMPDAELEKVQHVADPTLLLDAEDWRRLFPPSKRSKRHLVCYFISPFLTSQIDYLATLVSCLNVDVDIFVNDCRRGITFKRMLGTLSHKSLRLSASPADFVRAFVSADYVISDSFHALMFSSVNNANIRFIRPQDESRAKMFARVAEFASDFMIGDPFVETVEDAISSLLIKKNTVSFRLDRIRAFREKSREWIDAAIAGNAEACL